MVNAGIGTRSVVMVFTMRQSLSGVTLFWLTIFASGNLAEVVLVTRGDEAAQGMQEEEVGGESSITPIKVGASMHIRMNLAGRRGGRMKERTMQ